MKKIFKLLLVISIVLFGCSFISEELDAAIMPIEPIGQPTISVPPIEEAVKIPSDLFLNHYIDRQKIIAESNKEKVEDAIDQKVEEPQKQEEVKPKEDKKKEEPKKEEPAITFKEVDEIFYVSSSTLNIRTGAGTSYKKIGSFSLNDEVRVIGIGSNNWNKIIWNGQEAYVSAKHLSKNKTEVKQEAPKKEETKVEVPEQEKTKQEEAVTYKEVNETVYAISEVRIRNGAGSSFEIVGTLKKGENIQRIGIGSSGWSKVIYCGEEAYISSCYLTTDENYKEEPETVLEEMQRRGSMGRLTIPGFSVALFKASIYDLNESQFIVDNKDSAAYMTDGNGNIIIADHVHQGFAAIKKAKPNQTIATIDYGTYTEKYICTDNFIGRNTGSDLVDLNGNPVKGENIGGIIMYTCNVDGTVTITFWHPVN